jgi:hypothetical protein
MSVRPVREVGRRGVRRTGGRITKAFLGAFLGLGLMVASGPVAQAFSLPSDHSSSGAYQANGQVRAILSAGGRVWIGGQFDQLLTPSGGSGPSAPGIAALDPDTGDPVGGVTFPNLGGKGRFVYDFSEGPSGILYAAGNFTYQVGGHNYQNLIGIDPQNGQIEATFNVPSLRSVFAMNDRVLVGGSALWAYALGGAKIGSFSSIVPKVDASLRAHTTPPQIRDIVVSGGSGFAVGQFDWINNKPQKMAVQFDPVNGHVDSWEVSGLQNDSAAFGISLQIDGSTMYVGAGGSDFTAAYKASDGHQLWKTDTSGSSQVVTLWDSGTLIVGGHFDWVALNGSGSCGSNGHPNKNCLNQPRLTAMDASNGHTITSWRPQICCLYNGTWALDVDHGHLNVGGEFTKAGGRNAKYYAMFS